MITQQRLQGNWMTMKGKLRERWGQLTEDDFRQVEGNAEQLVGVIQSKTGEARERIEDYLETLLDDAESPSAGEAARDYAQQASEAVRHGYERAAEQVQHGYEQVAEQARTGYSQAEQCLKRNPLESVAVSFGAGILAGVVLGLMLRK